MNRKRSSISITLFAFCALLFESCLVDIPYAASNPLNDPEIVVPNVVNSAVVDSISSTIIYPNNDVILFRATSGDVKTIIESPFHLGFPDLIKYKDTWYASLRYSEGHLPKKIGYVIIAKSKDLKVWENEQIFTQEGYDLRDPKLFIANDSLYVHFNSTTINPYGNIRNDYISKYNRKSGEWGSAKMIKKNTNRKSWFWRITYNEGMFYTAAYRVGTPLRLYSSSDGINFNEIYQFDIKGRTTEATLRFYNDKAFLLLRMEDGDALFGEAQKNNLTDWNFKSINIYRFGGPNFLEYNNIFLLGGRDYNINKTKLYTYNTHLNLLKEIDIFPSVLDTGYPGMVIDSSFLYFLYFSGAPDNKHRINLAIIDLNKIIN